MCRNLVYVQFAAHYQARRVCKCVVCNRSETRLDATAQLFLGDQASIERRGTSRRSIVSGKDGGGEWDSAKALQSEANKKKKTKPKKWSKYDDPSKIWNTFQ